jgi:hypothetical protein
MAASRLLLALALALHAGTGGAQDEPPATGDPRSGNTVSPAPPAPPPQPDPVAVPTAGAAEPVAAARSAEPAGGASAAQQGTTVAPDAPAASPWEAPAAAREPPRAAPPRPADEDLPPAHPLVPPRAGELRWELMAGYGVAGAGAPNGLVGFGLTLGSIQRVRVEANVLFGWSRASRDVPASAAWNDGSRTYRSATTSARTFLLELSGSRRAGPFELWAGGGVHVSFVQLEAEYDETRCWDLLCFGGSYRTTDTDSQVGSTATGLLLSAGARLPVFERLLLALDVRYLAPATSTVADRYAVASRVGGFAATAGLTLRFGGVVPR